MSRDILRPKLLSSALDVRFIGEPPVRLNGPLDFRTDFRAGAFTTFGRYVDVQAASVGRYCTIGLKSVLGGTNHPTQWLSTNGFQYKTELFRWHGTADDYRPVDPGESDAESFRGAPAVIGNDVWLGANTLVLRGVTIGDGAVVGAGSVVTRDVPPYAVVSGVPAKVMRHRFAPGVVEELLELRWWRFTPNQLDGVPFDDVDAAIAEVRRRVAAGLEPYEPEPFEIIPNPRRSTRPTA